MSPSVGWASQAACIGVPTEVFLPWPASSYPRSNSRTGRQDPALAEPARAWCDRCPVREDCLAAAIIEGDRHSVRGGLTPGERLGIVAPGPDGRVSCPECGRRFSPRGLPVHRGRVHGVKAACGTPGAYQAHHRAGEPPCPVCRAGHAAAQRERRRNQEAI